MSKTHSTISLTLNWAGMICPNCLEDDDLNVSFAGTCRLTPSGSEDVGNHEWGDDSHCQCESCGFSAPVPAFRLGEGGETLEIDFEDPIADEREPGDDIRGDIDIEPKFKIGIEHRNPDFSVWMVGTVGNHTWEFVSLDNASLMEAAVFEQSLREKYADLLSG